MILYHFHHGTVCLTTYSLKEMAGEMVQLYTPGHKFAIVSRKSFCTFSVRYGYKRECFSRSLCRVSARSCEYSESSRLNRKLPHKQDPRIDHYYTFICQSCFLFYQVINTYRLFKFHPGESEQLYIISVLSKGSVIQTVSIPYRA